MTDSAAAPHGSLRGLKVVELAGLGPAPFAAMMMADHGAQVLRIDRPPGPTTDLRTTPLDRNRDTVRLDLRSASGLQVLLQLADRADVLIEGFRPGVAERLGFGPAICLSRNPQLIYGRMTGWGQAGPIAATAGHDINFIARTGVLHAIGQRGGPPQVPLNVVGDFGGGGMLLAFGICAALVERQLSGLGQVVDAAIVDGTSTLLAMQYGFLHNGYWVDRRGENVLDGGAPFYDVYRTLDEKWIAVGAVEDQFYAALLQTLGLSELPDRSDRRNWPAIRRAFENTFVTRRRAEWLDLFDGTDACVAPVLSFAEAANDPQLAARRTLVDVAGYVQPAPSPRFSRSPAADLQPSTTAAACVAETLERWGLPDVATLVAAGTVQ
jgi:alpha-methylacyl-CoA racemase